MAQDAGGTPIFYDYRIVNAYPHQTSAFTQGLFFHDGALFESTGRYGASSLRKITLATGEIEKITPLPASIFAEGAVGWEGSIFLLTWRAGKGFIFDHETFKQTGDFDYAGEGWGLTHDGEKLIMSDGASDLRFLDPETLEETGRLPVTLQGRPLHNLNELEWIDGEIFANIWQSEFIVRIDLKSGVVTGVIDLRDLLNADDITPGQTDVLNGIAYDAETGRLFVTGKNWPKLFEIELIEMGVSQGAVSKQVKILEDYIGAQLFDRRPEGLSLTQEGIMLRDSVAPAFDSLHSAFSRYSRRAPRSNRFRLATTASFASYFLAPRINAFAAALPHIDLEILTSDRVVDFAREDIDLSIRYGAGDWGDLICSEVAPGLLLPVCTPDVLNRAKNKNAAGLIASSERRIQVFSSNEWRAWEQQADIALSTAAPAFIFEHFVVAMQAVLAGQGYALLPQILVSQHLTSGEIVLFSGNTVKWGQTFHFARPPAKQNQPMVRDVIAWFSAAASE
ncbi:Glutaminyl-peptide cyclotransferase (Glutaminyl cyclase) [Durusdinium trenchii]|uniref:Probable RuBisCO transcriptional regulator n=1 Tax=Durusdinium trenchii TaxID=1381693 RepID=A0ABP0LKQ3_9DINO